jgi:hypothetical protein
MTGYKTTKQRGSGREHQALRKRVAATVEAGRAYCRRCGGWIRPGSSWHLGQTDDRRAYMGPEHRRCNTSAGGRNGGRLRARPEKDEILRPTRFSRVW